MVQANMITLQPEQPSSVGDDEKNGRLVVVGVFIGITNDRDLFSKITRILEGDTNEKLRGVNQISFTLQTPSFSEKLRTFRMAYKAFK